MEMALKLGTGTWGTCIDVKHAFWNQPMHKDDLHLLGFTFRGKHYINSSLPFGTASSCFIFEKVASALQWIITDQMGIATISHFLDDFPMLRQSEPQLKQFMAQFTGIMSDIGIPIADDKTLGPTQILEYLGLVLNFQAQILTIPQAKHLKCNTLISHMIQAFHTKGRKTTVKKIQKLAGSLNFICQALPAGQPFLCSLYWLTRGPTGCKAKSRHHRKITVETSTTWSCFSHSLTKQHTFPSTPYLSLTN